MPGQTVPTRAPDVATLQREVRDLREYVAQLDRRMAQDRGRELLAHTGVDTRGDLVGRLWLRPIQREQT